MRNIVILNSLHFSYPLPILMRVSYNTLIVKQNTSDYYKYRKLKTKSHPQEAKSPAGTKAYCRFVCLMLLLDLAADTFCQMVVDKACCLQMRVANRAPEELESPFFHVLAHGIGLGR